MQKICMLTSVHTPYDTRIFYKECKSLGYSGYQVVLIVPHDKDEFIEGVQILSVKKPKNRKERFLKTIWLIYKRAVKEKATVYQIHDPELIVVAVLLLLMGKKVIYDVHEDVPRQILSKHWIPKWMRFSVAKVVEIIEIISSRIFNGIVTATPTITSRFPFYKTVTIHNYPLLDEFKSNNEIPYKLRPPVITYIGGISEIRGVREIIAVISILNESLKVHLELAGPITPPELKLKLVKMNGWKYVKYTPWLDREGVGSLLGKSRVGLVVLRPTLNYIDSYPVKLFEYMAAGIPVIVSNFPLWRSIVEGEGCGICVDPIDPYAIANAIQWLINNSGEAEAMGKRGQEAVYKKYNWSVEQEKLLKYYQRLTK